MPEATNTAPQRNLYQGAYRTTLEDPDTQLDEPVSTNNTSEIDPELSAEERSWRKRYGDLRSYNTSLTQEVKTLKSQLQAASKKEIQIPSTKEEIEGFAQRYPDVFRHIRSIAMAEILSQKADLELETNAVKEDLEKLNRERAEAMISKKHPDYQELRGSEEFHKWGHAQSNAIQNMLYFSDDPEDCISALDLYKAQQRRPVGRPRSNGADTLVNRTQISTDVTDEGGNKIWRASEVAKMHPKIFEKMEAEIDKARREGRYDEHS